jgi:AcrR family transcriptional regulator
LTNALPAPGAAFAEQWEREIFLRAALEMVASSATLDDLQVAELVRRSGRHNAAFYRLFGAKEGLLLAVVEEAVRRAVIICERQMAPTRTPGEAVHAWSKALLELAAPEPAPRVPAIALDRFRLLRRFPDADATIADPLRQLLRDVLPPGSEPGPPVLAEAAFELILSRQASWIALGHAPTRDDIRVYADLVVRLVGLSGP